MEHTKKPILIYYLPYMDDREMQNAWKYHQKHCACVWAEDSKEAYDKLRAMIPYHEVPHIKVMGIATGRPEWVDEENPLTDSTPLQNWGPRSKNS